MQFSSFLLALAATTVSAQVVNNAVANSNSNGNTNSTVGDVSAVANAGSNNINNAPSEPPPSGGGSGYPEGGYPSGNPGYPVSTYCPVCDEARSNGGVYTTTYCTVYNSICPSGLTSATYTITQTCTGTTPIDYSTAPPGYTAVTTVCGHCPGAPTYTLTQPCDTSVPTSPYVTPYAPAKTPYPSLVTYTGAASSVAISAIAGVGAIFLGMLLL